MTTHDPTTLNQQGADRGTQYRSVIYYHNEIQQKIADEVLKQIQPYYEDKVVTELSALPTFYTATQEHQDFYKNNNGQGYCTFVIEPKLAKLRKLHADKLK
jgi:peptide-methionine (S)-S-oxide reductase